MTIWRIFGPEYREDVEIVGLKVWCLLEIIKRQLHENTERKMTKTRSKKTKKCMFCHMSVLLHD